MKSTRTSRMFFGLGSALALAIATSAFAGPGPQVWQEKTRAENAARKATAATETAKSAAMACPACKTTAVTEYRPSNAGGKVPARFDRVGTKHTCAACGGAITAVYGKPATNDMKGNCPICAKAGPTCCGVGT